jgi:hypothetical protein
MTLGLMNTTLDDEGLAILPHVLAGVEVVSSLVWRNLCRRRRREL